MTKSNRISSNQAVYLSYIHNNPGCSTADVVRACKWNPRAGHKWIYDSVTRLYRRGFVEYVEVREASRRGGAGGLRLTSKGEHALT